MTFENKKKILIVDDEVRWLKTIKNILIDDYELTLLSDPIQALEELRSHNYSLAILDMKFPDGKQGLELFEQMQKISPDIQAIILTGYPDIDDAITTFRIGALDYLRKGSNSLYDELRERVKKHLENKENAEILGLIANGESESLEFKSTARWDVRANKINKELEKVIVKTIAAFLNSEKGGTLIIGVDDDGNILGLKDDYKTLGKRQDRDGYENLLMTILFDSCGKECSPLVKIIFHQIEGKEICQINVKPSPKPIFVKDDKNENFYVRTGNSTRLLSTREAIEYCKIHWNS